MSVAASVRGGINPAKGRSARAASAPSVGGALQLFLLWQVGPLISGMQTFEALNEEQEQPGLSRFLQAWQSMVPAQCADPLALFHMHVHVHVCSI